MLSKIVFVLLLLFLSCFVVNNQAFTSELSEKAYIPPDRILVTTEGIFVLDETGWLPVQSIEFDGNGLYCKPLGWFCPRCKAPNGGSPPCRRCDWPNPDKR